MIEIFCGNVRFRGEMDWWKIGEKMRIWGNSLVDVMFNLLDGFLLVFRGRRYMVFS